MWRVEDENGLNGEVGPSEFYASRHNKDLPRQNPVTKSSEPSVTQLKTGVDSLAILTNGPAISRLGQNPNGQTSSGGAFRQYTVKNDLTFDPVRFKKPCMLSVTEQLFSLKMSGSQYLCTK